MELNYHQKYYQLHKEKVKEQSHLRYLKNAVKLGHIIRPAHCQECGLKQKVEGHHADYTKPFEVDWLCKKCHSLLSRKVETLNAS
jgi:hypothetical protein